MFHVLQIDALHSLFIGDVLLRMFEKLVPYVDIKRLLGFCENFISSSLLSCSSQEVEVLASVVYTVFLSSSCAEQLHSLESDGVVMPGDSGRVALSDTALKRLIEHTLNSNSEKLDCVLFAILSQKTSQNLPILALHEAASSTCSEVDSLVSSIKSLARDLILSSAEELCGVDKAYETHALQLESSSFLKEKLPPELDALLSGLQSKTQEKGLLDLTYGKMLFVNESDKAQLLSEDYVIRILDHCLIASTPICTKVACLLVENVEMALEYLTASPMLLELCETAASKTDQTKLHMNLYLLKTYLCTLAKKRAVEREGEPLYNIICLYMVLFVGYWLSISELLCGDWKEAVKVIRKKLWNRCSLLIVDGDCSPGLKVLVYHQVMQYCSLIDDSLVA